MSEPTQISKPSDSLSPMSRIKMQLTQTGMMRGARLDAETIKLYSARLSREPFEDVIAALQKIEDMPREQFESALPDVGTIVSLVRAAGIARHNREEAAKDQEYIAWRCPVCGVTRSGFFPKAMNRAGEVSYCMGPSQRTGAKMRDICGGNLTVVHRSSI